MAPLPPVVNGLRLSLRQTVNTDMDVLNRIYFDYGTTGPTSGQLNTWCVAVGTAWAAHISGSQHTGVALVEVTAEDISSSSAPIGSAFVSHAGTLTDQQLPAATAMVMRSHIIRRYRGGKPRTYLYVGGGNELSTPQTWDAGFANTVLAAWQAFIAAIDAAWPVGTGLISHINVSYYEGYTNFTYPSGRVKAIPKLRVGGPVTDTVDSYSVNPNVASQRRRNQTP